MQSSPITCQTKLNIAYIFTDYLLQNGVLNKSRVIQKQELLKIYETFQYFNHYPISSLEIISVLDQAFLLQRKEISNRKDKNFVEFKENVFRTDFGKKVRNLKMLDSGIEDMKCKICKMEFSENDERDEHFTSDIHILKDKYLRNRKEFPTKFKNVHISPTARIRMDLNECKIFEIILQNLDSECVDVQDVFELVNLKGVKTIYVIPRTLRKGDIFKLTLRLQFEEYGFKIFPIVIRLSTPSSRENLLLEPTFDVYNQELHHLIPTEPFQPLFKNNAHFDKLRIIEGIKIPSSMNGLATVFGLGHYKIPETLQILLDQKMAMNCTYTKSELAQLEQTRILLCDKRWTKVLHNLEGLNEKNYVDRFHLLMWIEEHQYQKEMHYYDQTDVELISRRKEEKLIGIEIPGLSEGRPSILKGDSVYIRIKQSEVKYEGFIQFVEENVVFVSPNEKFFEERIDDVKVDIEFKVNRRPLRLSHRALDNIKSQKVAQYMFPSIHKTKIRNVQLRPMFNKLIENNEQQKQAVRNIVQNIAFPAPYILFGPPGTGKTATLVEAITQVWKIFNSFRICVCAPSNSAADVITERLLKDISSLEILRLYGMSRADQEISEKLEKCCNFDRTRGELFIPTEKQIRSKRIVIITPVTAGRLVSAGIHGGFFDYIFMDEAGHAVEVEMIIPIIGFLTKPGSSKLTGSLVLAGDPKQLGPIVRASLALASGFDMSLLERIMLQCKLYDKDPEYNPEVITKLINNYRSHPEILHIPNLCFYDNELLAKGPEKFITCACEWDLLPVMGFPLIFHSVKGKEERESTSPSYFNISEIQIVQNYIQNLLGAELKTIEVRQNDIGIITPYRKQVQKIRSHLKIKNWDNIEVASVEEFQGKEKLIIIISTVRSRFELISTDYQFGLGFLKNAKRFNVALTRAKALLIVVGNPDILQCDPNWRKLIWHCINNDSYKGEMPSENIPSNFDSNESTSLNMPGLTINAGLSSDEE